MRARTLSNETFSRSPLRFVTNITSLRAQCVNAAPAAEPAAYTPVTAQRLEQPEPGTWLMYRRTYDSQGYSPLDQINAGSL